MQWIRRVLLAPHTSANKKLNPDWLATFRALPGHIAAWTWLTLVDTRQRSQVCTFGKHVETPCSALFVLPSHCRALSTISVTTAFMVTAG